jgi:hypothetical protein
MFFCLASLYTEATVVAIVCVIFLALFIVAGVREILKSDE